jgi:hypothetical protein
MAREYKEGSTITDMRRLIDQLEHAVTRFKGKTTITDADLRVMNFALDALSRYDKMACR